MEAKSAKNRVANVGFFLPSRTVSSSRKSLRMNLSLLLHFSTVIVWKWANLTKIM